MRILLLILLGVYLALVVMTPVLWLLTGFARSTSVPVGTLLAPFVPTLLFVGLAFFEVATRRAPYASAALGLLGFSTVLPTVSALITGFLSSALPRTPSQTLLSVVHLLSSIVAITIGVVALVGKTPQRALTPAGVTTVGSVAVYLAYRAISTTISTFQNNAASTDSLMVRYVPNVAEAFVVIERDQTSLFHVQGSWIVTAIVGILALVTLAMLLSHRSLITVRTVLVPGLLVCYAVAVIQAISSRFIWEGRFFYGTMVWSVSGVLVGIALTGLALLVYSASVTRWFSNATP